MLINPADVINSQTPFDICHDDEVVDPRITVLEVVTRQLFLSLII